jgi:hypothetical protein
MLCYRPDHVRVKAGDRPLYDRALIKVQHEYQKGNDEEQAGEIQQSQRDG